MKIYLKDKILIIAVIMALVFAMSPTQIVRTSNYEIVASVFPERVLVLPEYGNYFMKNDFPVAEDRDPARVKSIIATAYSSDPYQTDNTPCIPAINYDLCEAAERGEVNTIAANFLPKGTQVRFPEVYGDKIFVVRDRMNARYNRTNRIDFYTAVLDEDGVLDTQASKQKAKNFGLKRMEMEVFGK